MNLLLEGDDLEALLLRAHHEGGTSARIVRAEKVRRGGVLGFFAKEGFEVAVEIPQSAEPETAGPDLAGPDLAGPDLADTEPTGPESTESGLADPWLTDRGLTEPGLADPGFPMMLPAASRPRPTTLLQLAESTSAAERAAALAVALQSAYATPTSTPTDPPLQTHTPAQADLPLPVAARLPTDARFPAELAHSAPLADPPSQPEPPTPADLRLLAEARIPTEAPAPARITFAPIEFPQAGFPPAGIPPAELPPGRPWPERADPLSSEWATGPPTLNDVDQSVDVPTVTDLPEVNDAAAAPDAASTAPEAELWFNTKPAQVKSPVDFDVDPVGTDSPEPPPPPDPPSPREPPPPPEPERSPAPLVTYSDWSLEPNPSGDVPPAGTGTPRATTVVPRHRPRRGSATRPLPVPRPPIHDEPDHFLPDEPVDDDAGATRRPGRRHAVGHQEPEADPAAAVRTSNDAAWRLLRGWRPGGRRRLNPPFTDAATQGVVPAAAAMIGSIDQLAADREALRALGVPAAWTRHLAEGDRFTSIVAMLGRLPELKIPDEVAVIAVIGPADGVELEAHRTALDLPVDGRPRAVALVPAEGGVERRAAMAKSKRVRPVVISIPINGYDDPDSVRKILTDVEAEAVIAVVDARRPLEEITRWVEALERVDAIALDGALDVEGPAAVLGLDVPVIRVDGIAVDRIGWAALLCAQLPAPKGPR